MTRVNFSPALLCLLMPFMPESPSFLMSSGKEAAAAKTFQRLNWSEAEYKREMKSIKEAQVNAESMGDVGVVAVVTNAEYLRPLSLVFVLMFLQQFSGINVVTFYAQTIFRHVGSDIDPGKYYA